MRCLARCTAGFAFDFLCVPTAYILIYSYSIGSFVVIPFNRVASTPKGGLIIYITLIVHVLFSDISDISDILGRLRQV